MKSKSLGHKGCLIVFEGIDGSGKTTQIKHIKKYIKQELHRRVEVVQWKSSSIVGKYLQKMSELEEQPSALALSLIVAADLSENVAKKILPALAQGKVVLCDRYSYTGIVRDAIVNGFDSAWLQDIYSFVPKPDKVFYFRVNAQTSIGRVDARLKHGLQKMVKQIRKKYGAVSDSKLQALLVKLQNNASEGSMAGSMEDTLRALRKGERLFQVNGDPLTEEIALKQREELIEHLLYAYTKIAKHEQFAVINAMQSEKAVTADLVTALDDFLAPAVL